VTVVRATGDRHIDRRFPASVIGLSVVLFALWMIDVLLPAEIGMIGQAELGFVPSALAAVLAGGGDPIRAVGLVTALFVHGSAWHLGGNLAYLWVFGIPVERAIGALRFLVAFLVLGGLANLSVVLGTPDLDRIVVGASGGVSAIIGLYLGLFPTRRIGLWLPLGLFLQFARIPALLVIGSWFTLQLLYWVFGPMSGAVAWWTHVAGFFAGLGAAGLARLFGRR